MSEFDDHGRSADEHPLRGVAGLLASGVSGELSRPLRELRESLATMVETIDRYIGDAEGPTPYPWKSLQALRQDLAQAYLVSREAARLASELNEAVTMTGGVREAVDVNRQIEAAIDLVRHRIARHTELFIDLGSIPPVLAVAGEVTLIAAKLIVSCAESAAAMDGSALLVRTAYEDGEVVMTIADNGRGLPETVASARGAVAPIVVALGGSFEGVAEGQGSVYECRIPVRPPASRAATPPAADPPPAGAAPGEPEI